MDISGRKTSTYWPASTPFLGKQVFFFCEEPTVAGAGVEVCESPDEGLSRCSRFCPVVEALAAVYTQLLLLQTTAPVDWEPLTWTGAPPIPPARCGRQIWKLASLWPPQCHDPHSRTLQNRTEARPQQGHITAQHASFLPLRLHLQQTTCTRLPALGSASRELDKTLSAMAHASCPSAPIPTGPFLLLGITLQNTQ